MGHVSRFILQLPQVASIVVQEGQTVQEHAILASCQEIVEHEEINISAILHVPARKIPSLLSVHVSQVVKPGDILARKKSIFTETYIRSPFLGTVVQIDTNRGSVWLETKRNPNVIIRSPINGTVVKIASGSLELEYDGILLHPLSIKGTIDGDLFVLSKEAQDLMQVRQRDVEGKIVAGDRLSLLASKLIALNAKAIIATDDIQQTLTVPFAVLSLESFETLSFFSGKHVILDELKKLIMIKE